MKQKKLLSFVLASICTNVFRKIIHFYSMFRRVKIKKRLHRLTLWNLFTPIIVMTLPLEARNEVPFIIVGFADRPVSNVWRSQPLIFYRQKLCKIIFANLKNLFSLICGFRFPDSGFRILVSYSGFRIPDSGFRLRIPVSGFRLLELPNSDIINCRILSAGQLSTGNHKSQKTSSSNLRKLFCIAFVGKKIRGQSKKLLKLNLFWNKNFPCT